MISFKRKRYIKSIILMVVRWYLAYGLSYRDKKAATKFFVKSLFSSGKPEKINIDKSGSNTYALEDINSFFRKPRRLRFVKINT